MLVAFRFLDLEETKALFGAIILINLVFSFPLDVFFFCCVNVFVGKL